ncbi:S protein [Salmonella enterica]|nr:S protein [Salmonella enterica]EKQ4565872.1 S protein [Salmonella enterica subsp. enterica serovar Montevideo]EHC1367625.1 S protein [Salmonella enterica]EHY2432202.1 S protein [Salmonella enterica]EIN8634153.1 S protein [Salmonella enterica]
MANLPETPQWESGIYQIEVSDPVLGGPDGISNRQAKQLASRTSYLKQKVEKSGTDLAAHIAAVDPHTQYATKASPTFTGTPTAPTPANGDNSKKLATTEFVAKALAALAGSAPETLDTLKELADALGNDPNFATTVLNKLAEKLAKDQNGADIPEPALFVKNLGLRELGTSGEKIPLLSTANTWTNRQTFSGGLSGELSGNASTAAKLKTARKISNVAFDGSSDITLKASHVGAFALGKTGSTVANDKAVGWNWSSGAYNATISGASTLIIHFYMGEGSCPAAQFRINYKNGGIFYRSARDGYGFEADWSEFYTTTRKPSAGDVGAYTKAECNSRFITGVRLGGLSSVQTWNGPGWSDKSGYVVTGSVNGNRDELIDTTQARPIQYCINGTWYNAGSI